MGVGFHGLYYKSIRSNFVLIRTTRRNARKDLRKQNAMKEYLGDGVYARDDGYVNGLIILTTEDGVRVTNIIYLEPQVIANLQVYLKAKGYKTP